MRPKPKPNRSSATAAETRSINPNHREPSLNDGALTERFPEGKSCVRTTRKASPPVGKTSEGNEEQQLLVSRKEVCRLLGNISARSVARLEERGLLRSTGLLRHKLYRRADVEALANEELNWEA